MAVGTDGAPPAGTINVGADGGELRYILAKEAVRQGEARLGAQAAVRTALEARATALTGWAAVTILATTGAASTARNTAQEIGAVAASIILFAAASLGVHAARPRDWSMVGYDPEIIIADTLQSELEVLESIAGGLTPGIQANNTRLENMGRMLRWVGWLLLAAPAIGAAVYKITVWSGA